MALCCKMYYYLRVLFLKNVLYELLIADICFVEGYVFSKSGVSGMLKLTIKAAVDAFIVVNATN